MSLIHDINFSISSLCPPQKQPSLQGNEEQKEGSRPNSMASNSSFHSTQDEFEVPAAAQADRENGSGGVSFGQEEEGSGGGGKEEIRLLRQALESVQVKLLETRKENRSLKAQLAPERDESVREEELMESLAELQAKLTDTQERYHQAVEEVEELRAQVAQGGAERTSENQELQTGGAAASRLEVEVKQLKEQLAQTGSQREEAAQRVTQLEEALVRAEEGRRGAVEEAQRGAQIEELYKEAQEEIRMLQVEMGF